MLLAGSAIGAPLFSDRWDYRDTAAIVGTVGLPLTRVYALGLDVDAGADPNVGEELARAIAWAASANLQSRCALIAVRLVGSR